MLGDGQRVLDVGDTQSANGHDAISHDPKRDAGNAVLLHLRFGERDEGVEARVGGSLGAQLALRAARNRDQCGRDAGREPARDERAHDLMKLSTGHKPIDA